MTHINQTSVASNAKPRSDRRWIIQGPPRVEANKMPGDVYLRMRHCFGLIRQLAEAKGIATLRFEIAEEGIERVSPNDVGDLASLVVEELTHLHRQFPDARSPVRAYYPGRRFPAHVFQRVGLLERLLEDLIEAWGAAVLTDPSPQGG